MAREKLLDLGNELLARQNKIGPSLFSHHVAD